MKNAKPTIYLAGGFYADNWQEKVISGLQEYTQMSNSVASTDLVLRRMQVPHYVFLNPKDKERGSQLSSAAKEAFSNPGAYTTWDLAAIQKSDIVFAYIDKENPAVGVIAEIGYSVGQGKHVVLVIDPDHVYFKDRYFDFLRNMPGVVNFSNLESGIAYTRSFIEVLS